MPRQRIRFAILGSWLGEDFEVDAGQLLRPSCLSSVQYFGSSKVFQVVMIRENLNLVGRSLTILSPVFEDVYHCKKFLVVDFVVDFRGLKFCRVEGYSV